MTECILGNLPISFSEYQQTVPGTTTDIFEQSCTTCSGFLSPDRTTCLAAEVETIDDETIIDTEVDESDQMGDQTTDEMVPDCPNGEPFTGCENDGVMHNGQFLESAEEVCRAVQEQKEQYKSDLEVGFEGAQGIIESISPYAQGASVLNNLIDSGFGEQDIINQVANVVGTSINNTSVSESVAQCSSLIEETNLNEIIIGGWDDRCREQIINSGLPPGDISELLSIEVSDIDQSIKGQNTTRCLLDAAQNAVQDDLSEIENVALNSALHELQGGGKTESTNKACNLQSQTKDACQYLRNAQCCYSGIKTERTNSLQVNDCLAKVRDVNQDIDTDNTSSCGNFVEQKSGFELSIESTISVVNDIKSSISSSPLLMLLSVLGIIVFVVGIYVYFNKGEVKDRLQGKSSESGSDDV